MKLIPVLLLGGMLAVSGWAEDYKPEPYSAELLKKAKAGDAKAQRDLGLCYFNGDGVTQNYEESTRWSSKSVESFHAQMEKTFSATMRNYKPEPYSAELVKKAKAGDAKAQCDLGVFYYKGEGVTQDYEEAFKWLTKSAEQGNANAQVILGNCYYFGKGVVKDEKEAMKWWNKVTEGAK